ncbi:MAG: hypothetical protein DHS20C15_30600 [Planctomycetota bacterium]|nr:MAG: hypothetical protein DHS20C15_30600 [Planctomycetota bacterium]
MSVPSDPAAVSDRDAAHFLASETYKRDLFGRIERGTLHTGAAAALSVRDDAHTLDSAALATNNAPRVPGRTALPAVRRSLSSAHWVARPFARWLARREVRALLVLGELPDVPRLLAHDRDQVVRSLLPGEPMQDASPRDPAYFRDARRLLTRLHRLGVTHNDLAKEPNWLVLDDGRPGIVDFQLARVAPRRGRLFRLLAREDLRHLLKHKRSYCPDALTPRERALLANPSGPARWLRRYAKPVYSFVTRKLLGWRDREGRGFDERKT